MSKNFYALLLFFISLIGFSQEITRLTANEPGNTYELISSVLAPGYNPIEAPGIQKGDCDNHASFKEHISEVFDKSLEKNVFKFVIHVNDDNDRCKNFDRQRNEIKAFRSSPDNLKATQGETVAYGWKFKLEKNFQPSKSFTHLHQLKSVDEKPKAKPLITLTARKGATDYLELRYSSGQDQKTLKKVPLDAFRGRWVEVVETVTYGVQGSASYNILITDVENDDTILEYEDKSLSLWQDSASFARPKWGIYRSLKNKQDLRDEEVLFADFVITEK